MRLVAKYIEGDEIRFVNILAESIIEKDGYLFAYCGEKLVGVFDIGLVVAAYLSGEVKNER